MTDPNRYEPKNGDFVAYLESLQRDSLDELKRANAGKFTPPPTADETADDRSLRELAAEILREKRRTPSNTVPTPAPAPEPTARPQNTDRQRASVADEFRGRPEAAPLPHRRRSKNSFAVFIGTAMMLFGGFGFVVAASEGIDALVSPAVFVVICGYLVRRIASR